MEAAAKDKRMPPVLDNVLGHDRHGKRFVVTTPLIYCCNCGTREGLSCISTAFIEPFKLSNRGRGRRVLHLGLPYCAGCATRIDQFPGALTPKLFFWIAAWLAAELMVAGLLAHAATPVIWLGVIATTVAIVGIRRWLVYPRAPMTAKYLPVKILEYDCDPRDIRGDDGLIIPVLSAVAENIVDMGHAIKGTRAEGIDQLTFEFTNRLYGKAFGKVNADNVERGRVRFSKRSRH